MSGTPGMDAAKIIASLHQFVDFMDVEVHDSLAAALDRAVGVAKSGHFYDRTGDLRNQIRYTIDGKSSDDTIHAAFGAYTDYASYVEDGTPPHKIEAKNAKVLQIPIKGGGFFYRKSVNHPGTKPVHFMLDAVDSIDMPVLLDHAIERAMARSGFNV